METALERGRGSKKNENASGNLKFRMKAPVLGLAIAFCRVEYVPLLIHVVRTLGTVPIPPIVSDGALQAALVVKTKSIPFARFVNWIG
jgi:hypothetical protein